VGTRSIAERSRNATRALLAVSGLVAAVGAVLLIATPAQAGCTGRGAANEYSITYYTNGTAAAREHPYPYSGTTSTCDGDSQYRGQVQDSKTDGHCAYVVFRDPTDAVEGSECTTGAWATFTGWDQQGNSDAYYALCLNYNCSDFPVYYHTWGF
jgi:hypothetical protein